MTILIFFAIRLLLLLFLILNFLFILFILNLAFFMVAFFQSGILFLYFANRQLGALSGHIIE